MKMITSKSKEVRYIDSRAWNHMTSHEEWFSYLEKLEQPRVVKTGEDIPQLIKHLEKVRLSHVGQKGKLMNLLHVPTITKNFVSVRQIVDGYIIAQGRRDGMMFILDTNDIDTALFAKG